MNNNHGILNISFDLIKNFVYVAKFKSYSKASKYLYLTQSAISQSINRLENQLSVKLFIRKNGEVLLTDEGKILYEECSKGERSFKLGISHVLNFKVVKNKIRIKVNGTLANLFLYPKIDEIQKMLPGYNIELIRTIHDYDTQEELLENIIDICITDEIITNRFIKSTTLSEMTLKFLYNPKLVLERYLDIEYILKKYPIAINNRDSLSIDFLNYLKKKEIKTLIEMPHYEMIIDLIKSNCCIGVAPYQMDKEKILHRIEVNELEEKKYNIYAYTNKNNQFANKIANLLIKN